MLNEEQRDYLAEILRAARHKSMRSLSRMTELGPRSGQTVEEYDGIRFAMAEKVRLQDRLVELIEDDESWPDE